MHRHLRLAATIAAPCAVAATVLGVAATAIFGHTGDPNGLAEVPVANPTQQYTVTLATTAPTSTANPADTIGTSMRASDFTATTATTAGTVQWPLAEKDANRTDGFGPRTPPCPVCSSNHRGQDFAGTEGEPVAAIADGTVIQVVPAPGVSTLGVYVVIEHELDGHTIQSVYAHLVTGSVTVKVGDRVRMGDQIGKLGNTGASTGPHLHLEIIVDGVHVDPLAFLRTHADGTPVHIRTLPEIEWAAVPDGAEASEEADGWQPPAPDTPPAAPNQPAEPPAKPANPATAHTGNTEPDAPASVATEPNVPAPAPSPTPAAPGTEPAVPAPEPTE